jgi:tetratricopeptide (TPR) repeat protein
MMPLVLGCLAYLTRRQIGIWRDTGALWQRAIHVDPTNGRAYSNMGSWLYRQGKLKDALAYHRKGIRLRPGRAGSYSDTGAVLSRLGRNQEAIQAYEAALRIDSRCLGAHNGSGRILVKSSDPNEIERGLSHLTEALRIDPASAPVRVNLAAHYERTRQYSRAAEVLREGLRRSGPERSLVVRLAWLLATCPDATVRNGREAMSWARRGCAGPGAAEPVALATLAAALAETGQFPEAVQAAERGAAAARRSGRQDLEAEIKRHIAAYLSGQPWRSGK